MTTRILTHLLAAIVGGAVWSALVLIADRWLKTAIDLDQVDEGAPRCAIRTSAAAGDWERWAIGRRP